MPANTDTFPTTLAPVASAEAEATACATRCVGSAAVLNGWLAPALITLAGGLMLAWTWGTWPDPLTDAGRELYVPWRLALGERLYADIAYFNGPLSPYLNTLWFKLFGVGSRTLIVANIAIAALLLWLLFRLVREIADDVAAFVAGLVFVLVFAFGQYSSDIDNYNYVLPYSHEATHGLLLAVASLYFLSRYLRRNGKVELLTMAVTVGLVFLTKPEMFLAAIAAVGFGLAADAWIRRLEIRAIISTGALFITAMIAPVLFAWGLLSLTMPPAVAGLGVLGGWPATLGGHVARLPFYREIMGLLDVRSSLLWLGLSGVVYAAFVGGTCVLSMSASRWPRLPRILLNAAVSLLVMGAGLWMATQFVDAGRPLPVVVAAIGIAAAIAPIRQRHDLELARVSILRIAVCVLALVMLLKIALYARTFHYGVFLAMPATLLAVTALVTWLPQWLRRRGWDREIARFAGVGFCVALIAVHLATTARQVALKREIIAAGADSFRADARAGHVNEMLRLIEHHVQPDQSIIVLPEGVMLNYLSRRRNPTPYVTFMPPELIMFGEGEMIAAFEARPPDFICLMQRDTSEYGYRGLGRGYGQHLYNWVLEHYRPIQQVGASPLDEAMTEPGMLLMRRTSPGRSE